MLAPGSILFKLLLVTALSVPQDLCILNCLHSSLLGRELWTRVAGPARFGGRNEAATDGATLRPHIGSYMEPDNPSQVHVPAPCWESEVGSPLPDN